MQPRQFTAELYARSECVLGEGPFWFQGKTWWIDIEQGFLLSVGNPMATVESRPMGERIGSAVPAGAETLLLALERSLVLLDLSTGRRTAVAEAPFPPGSHRFNDGKCDPAGRFLVGTLDRGGAQGTDALYAHERGGSLRTLRWGASISNGLAWSQDGTTLYYIDTPLRSVLAFDYDVQKGAISRERTVLEFGAGTGFPDGMTIDTEGRLWIAFWDGGTVRGFDPGTGACVAEVRVPCARPTSCCFGGPGLDRLFITTARQGLGAAALADQPLAGSLFACDTGARGFAPVFFS